MRTVLVTGGTGLVGRSIASWRFPEKPFERVMSVGDDMWVFVGTGDADLRDKKATIALFDAWKPTHVIHLAGRVGGLFYNLRDNRGFFEDNLAINLNVLGVAADVRCEKVLSCLSTCVFPDKIASYPFDETALYSGPPHPSNIGYSYAKRMCDIMSQVYRTQGTTRFVTICPTNLYGPYDNFSLRDGHVIPALIHKAVVSKKAGTPLSVVGTGKPLRQFMFARDAAELMCWALDHYEEHETLILSPDEEVTINRVARTVADAAGVSRVVFEPGADGQHRKTASNVKLRKYLPNYVFTTLEDGINETVRWFESSRTIRT